MEKADPLQTHRSAPWKAGLVLAVGLLLIGWLLNTPAGWLGKADAIGYAVCHQIEARSFHLGNRTFPLCVRCSGMYLGALVGLAYQGIRGRRLGGYPPRRLLIFFGGLVIAFVVDGVNSFIHLAAFPVLPWLYEPQNWIRLLTGTGMGLTMAMMLYPAFVQTVWRDWEKRPALADGRALGMLLLLAALLDLAMVSEVPVLLYPLALLSVATVLMILTMVYTMAGLLVLKLENQYTHFIQLILPLTGGFGITLLQIIIFEVLRYTLTGAWDGLKFD
jgi:uncharacterized membrane protein